jgi:hypothetical protein
LRLGTTDVLCPLVPSRLRSRFLGAEGVAGTDKDESVAGVPALAEAAPGVDRSGPS